MKDLTFDRPAGKAGVDDASICPDERWASRMGHFPARILRFALVFLLSSIPALAQGPSIQTDTPIMLGLEGRGIRAFGTMIRKATFMQDGKGITDPMDRRLTAWLVPIVFPYNFLSDRIQWGAVVPLMNMEMHSNAGDVSRSGIGDVRIFAKYLDYQYDRKNKTVRIASKAGIKLPTGDDATQPALGLGSTDYFFSTVAAWIAGRVGVYLEGIYEVNTSRGSLDYGNGISYNLAFGYRMLPSVYGTYPSRQLNGFIEINGTTSGQNTVESGQVNDSGGTTIFVSPEIQYVGGRRWLIEASFQFPVEEAPNGAQLGTDWALSFGTRVLLF